MKKSYQRVPLIVPKRTLSYRGPPERMARSSKHVRGLLSDGRDVNAVPCIFYTVFPWGPSRFLGGGQNDVFAPSSVAGVAAAPPAAPSSAALAFAGSDMGQSDSEGRC